MALEINKSVDERGLSASTLVAGRAELSIFNGCSLEINMAFSIHPWNSRVWNTDCLCALEGSLWNYFMNMRTSIIIDTVVQLPWEQSVSCLYLWGPSWLQLLLWKGCWWPSERMSNWVEKWSLEDKVIHMASDPEAVIMGPLDAPIVTSMSPMILTSLSSLSSMMALDLKVLHMCWGWMCAHIIKVCFKIEKLKRWDKIGEPWAWLQQEWWRCLLPHAVEPLQCHKLCGQ